ncbi:MAG: DUF58 domain-containing protein [Actinomycetaceae bacterium]
MNASRPDVPEAIESHAVVHGSASGDRAASASSPHTGSPPTGPSPGSAHSPYSIGQMTSGGSTTGRWRTSARSRVGALPGLTTALERTIGPRREMARVLGGVSALGWTVLGLGLAALVVALVLGWGEAMAGSVALLALFAVAVAFTIGRQSYSVDLRLSDRRVTVGDRALAGVIVTNTGSRSTAAARLEVPVGPGQVAIPLPGLSAGGSVEELLAVPTQRRSVVEIGPARTVRGDPLGLLRSARTWTEVLEMFVHPRTVRLASASAGLLHDLEGRPTTDLTESDLSFHALREYTPGDDRRYIHWRTSARTGKLMVRQFEESRRSHVVVAVSTSAADYDDPDELETAVSAVGSLGLQAITEDKELTVLTTARQLPAVSARTLLDNLTRLTMTPTRTQVVDMAREVALSHARATLAVLVCGSPVPLRDIRAAGSVLPVGMRALAVRADAYVEPSVAAVGPVTVVTVPNLDALTRGLHMAAL